MKIMNGNRLFEEENPDEMQKALSSEIGAKCLRVWYVLNSYAVMACVCLSMIMPQIPTYVYMLCLMAVMYICLSLYNLKAAKKGVLTAFTGYKPTKSGKTLLLAYSVFSLFVITSAMLNPASILRRYAVFWVAAFIMAAVFNIVTVYAERKNNAVIKEQETEEN